MALQVSGNYSTPFGTTLSTTYWRWVGLGIDVSQATATLQLYGYVDEAAFNDGKSPIGQRQYQVMSADFATFATQVDGPSPAGLSATIYQWIKDHDDMFTDATEV